MKNLTYFYLKFLNKNPLNFLSFNTVCHILKTFNEVILHTRNDYNFFFQLSTLALCTLLVAGIRSESEPGISSSLYKDGHQEFVHQFHNGQTHELTSNSGNVAHLVPSSQFQDHQAVIQDQVSHSSGGHGGHVSHGQVPSAVNSVGPVSPGPIGPVAPVPTHVSQIVPFPYTGQKSDFPVHAGGRAIGK